MMDTTNDYRLRMRMATVAAMLAEDEDEGRAASRERLITYRDYMTEYGIEAADGLLRGEKRWQEMMR